MGRMHEPYVADPAEPTGQPLLARARPAVATLALIVLLVAAATLFLQGRGEEDPALNAPTPAAES